MPLFKYKKIKIVVTSMLAVAVISLLGVSFFVSPHAFACTPDQEQSVDASGNSTCGPCPSGQEITTTDSSGNSQKVCCQSGSSPTTDKITNQPTCSTVEIGDSKQSAPTNGCGAQPTVLTSIDFGCRGDACVPGHTPAESNPGFCGSYENPVLDALFSIIKFLSDGVGIVVVASIIVGGIQFSLSRDNPESAMKARGRITTSLVALVIFIFAYAILNYLVPAGLFQ